MRRTREQKQIDLVIWHLWKKRCTYREIAALTGTGFRRISSVLTGGANYLKHERGRPSKLTSEVRNLICELTTQDCRMSDQNIRNAVYDQLGVPLSRSTVNTARHDADFHWGPPKPCPRLTDDQINSRRQFVMDFNGELYSGLNALPFVFSDESRFCDSPDSRFAWSLRGGIKGL